MKITMKRNQRIRLVLDLINKKSGASPKKETFYFQYEEFTTLPLLNDRVMLDQLFNRIQKESDCIIFILPKIPEHLIGKSIIEEGSEKDAAFEALRNLYKKEEDVIKLDSETIRSFSTITVHIEDPEKFDRYRKTIERELKEEKIPMLILNGMGKLYVKNGEGKERFYPMEKDGSRHRIVHYLATEKRWLTSKEIAEECNIDSTKVGKTIEQIRRNIEDFLEIRGNKIIESERGSGYRIKNIKIRD